MKKMKTVVVRTGVLWAGVCLAANAMAAATPLLDFSFNEGTGTNVTDSVSHLVGQVGNYADPANAPVVVTDTPSGAAGDKAVSLNFGNATMDGFLVADDSQNKVLAPMLTNVFTVETWVKRDTTDVRIFEGLGGYGNSCKLGLNASQIQFTLFGIVDINSGLFLPLDDAWHHVAVVWTPGVGATFFLDGGSETPIAETRSMRAFGNNYLVIGAESVVGNAVQGIIDRFRIHMAALTVDQLDSVAATPKAPLSSTVVSFNFSESGTPFANSGTAALQANRSNPYWAALTSPKFVTDTPSGKTNDYALNFKAGDRVVVPDPNVALALDPADPSFTIQAWLKPGVLPNPEKSVIFFNNAPGGAVAFSISTDRHLFVTTLGILDVKSPKAILPDDGQWHHGAVVHENGKELRFYVDGGLADTVAYTGGVIFTRTDTSFMFGSENGGNPYVGSLDRFKFSKGILTADQLDSWPIPGVQPGSPELTIEAAVRVSWPTTPGGYSLQTSTDLVDPKNWTTVTNAPLVDSRGYFMVFPTSSTKVFYRLFKP
jgi:hypothetical protein